MGILLLNCIIDSVPDCFPPNQHTARSMVESICNQAELILACIYIAYQGLNGKLQDVCLLLLRKRQIDQYAYCNSYDLLFFQPNNFSTTELGQ